MGETATFRSEDKIGLAVAILLHAALVLVLALQFAFSAPPPMTPQRMTVSLATEVSLASTAPDPVPESRAAIAPRLDDEPAPPVEENETAEAPAPPPPQTRTPDRTRTQPSPRPTPRPTTSPNRGGGSRIGDDFLGGQGGSTNTDEIRIPASQIGRSARASLQQAINRQLSRYWDAPSGLEAEQLVTVLAFRLNEDGSLAGRPRVVRQTGITDSNRPQAPLHAERAIRAVQRAAPFDLPPEYYEAWKNITSWRFDRRL